MNELHLFAGGGGGILGGILLGHTCVCAVEIEPYPRKILLQRQRDGILPRFPIWDDVRTFDGKPWRGLVDIVCGGFPCQDISTQGRGEGIDGSRSGLWAEMARIIREVQPKYVLVENSPALTFRGLGRVHGDLATIRYDDRWGVFGACELGFPHSRERLFLLANPSEIGYERGWAVGEKPKYPPHGNGIKTTSWNPLDRNPSPESLLAGEANGMANKLDRIAALGNGQVPAVVRLAWETLMAGRLEGSDGGYGGVGKAENGGPTMTATPREPTREEVEGADLRCMGPDALMNEADKYLPVGPPQMEIYRRLKERDALLAQQQWLPISTAPKDGTSVLLFWPYWSPKIPGVGKHGLFGWQAEFSLDGDSEPPTHWLPLPPPPEEKGG